MLSFRSTTGQGASDRGSGGVEPRRSPTRRVYHVRQIIARDTFGSSHAPLNRPTSRSVGRSCAAPVATTEKPVLQPVCDGLLEKWRL